MRKLATVLGVTILVPTAAFVTATTASAGCPDDHNEGTVPGTQSQVYPDNNGPVYIDDRGFLLPDNGGGLWIYLESNNKKGLQRGGKHVTGVGEIDGVGSFEDTCKQGTAPYDTILL